MSRDDAPGPERGASIAARLEQVPAGAGGTVFAEERADLSVVATADGAAAVDRSWWAGISVHREGRSPACVYRSATAGEDGEPGTPAGDSAGLDPRGAVEAVRRCIGLVVSERREVAGSVRWIEVRQRVWIRKPDGETVSDERRGVRVHVDACDAGGGPPIVATAELTSPGPEAIEGLARRVLHRLEERRGARAIAAGPREVVFAPGVAGVAIHEIVGHALEADTSLAGESWLEVGARVAPVELRIVDDPRRGRVPWRLDDEGEPAGETTLVEGGRVVGRLFDRRTASLARSCSTGHARRATYRDRALPRMGCTWIAEGSHDAAELMHRVRDGVYVRSMTVGHADPRTGRAVFHVADADRVLRGRIAEPLRPFVLAIEGRTALGEVRGIANDLAFDRCVGSCHRLGQSTAASVGAPTVWLGAAMVCA